MLLAGMFTNTATYQGSDGLVQLSQVYRCRVEKSLYLFKQRLVTKELVKEYVRFILVEKTLKAIKNCKQLSGVTFFVC